MVLDAGIIPRAISYLFDHIGASSSLHFHLVVGTECVEILDFFRRPQFSRSTTKS